MQKPEKYQLQNLELDLQNKQLVDSDQELWLLSYSDLMTLLFCFFVFLYAYSSHHSKTRNVERQLAEQFHGPLAPVSTKVGEEIRKAIRSIPDIPDLEIDESPQGLTVALKTGFLFPTGASSLRPEVKTAVGQIISQLKPYAQHQTMVIEGHSDDRPITSGAFEDNWTLSAARAAAVVRLFEAEGFRADQLVAVGYGSSRPAFANRDAEGHPLLANMEKNRRVVIRLLIPRSP